MKLIVLAVLAVAAARADYHDGVFHFSTLRSPVALAGRVAAVPAYSHYDYQDHYAQRPSSYYSEYVPAAYYSQYTPATSASTAYYSRYSPAVSASKAYYTQSQYYTPAAAYKNAYHTQYAPAAAYNNAYHTQYAPAAAYNNAYHSQYAPAVASTSNAAYYAPVQYARSASPAVVVDYINKPAVIVQSPVAAPAVASSSAVRLQPAAATSRRHYSLGNLYSGSGTYAPAYNYRILKQVQEVDPSGPYRAHYATENGITASEEGVLVGGGPEGPAVAKHGSYSYTGPDGVLYSVNWVADEYGFRASGAHLPQA